MGSSIRARLVVAVVATTGFGPPTVAARVFSPPPPPLVRISPDALCVTNGEITTLPDGRMAINTPSSRGIVRAPSDPSVAEIRFRYVGPSPDAKPLASGEIRRQIGLKLHAQDQCNLLYVMWRIEPNAELVVSTKLNPGQGTHEECGARGYTNIKPQHTVKIAPMMPGESHTLRAELSSNNLSVYADDALAWQGSLDSVLNGLDGPLGLRTDNAHFELAYYVRPIPPGSLSPRFDEKAHCQRSPED